jgi:hypothetical protein
MKASDVIEQLQTVLPKVTGLFSDDIPVTSLTRAGAVVTAVTSTPHGLDTGQEVVMSGAKELNPITSLTFSNGIASGVTQNSHDLTLPSLQQVDEDNIYDFNKAVISGAGQSEYNGTFILNSVINRKNFSYLVSGSPASPDTGSPVLEQEFGYNGRFAVTVIDPTTFTYQITVTPESPAGGTIIARSPMRVSGGVSFSRLILSYTEQPSNKLWAFVVLEDVNTSRNRSIKSDAINESSGTDEYRNRLIEPFSIYIFIPGVDSISGRPLRDDMEEIRGFIYEAILGVVFPTGLKCQTWSQITPTGDRYAGESSLSESVYIHQFTFERVVDVTYPDTKGPDRSVAFRDIKIDSTINSGTGDLDVAVNLDQIPL